MGSSINTVILVVLRIELWGTRNPKKVNKIVLRIQKRSMTETPNSENKQMSEDDFGVADVLTVLSVMPRWLNIV
jgi:hypothetical protein